MTSQRLPSLKSFQVRLMLFCALAGIGLFVSRLVEIPERSALRGWDNSFYVMWVRSIIIDGDIHFANELRINNTIAQSDREKAYRIQMTETGYVPNKYGIGWGLVSLPFYYIADFGVVISNALGINDLERDGYNWVYQVVLQFGHLGLALVGIYYAWRLCALFFSKPIALKAVLSVWGSSMLLYYQSLNLSMAHSLVFSLVAINYFYASRLWMGAQVPSRKTLIVLLSICTSGGLLAVTRYQACVYLLFPAVAMIRFLMLSGKAKAAKAQVFAMGAIGCVPVLLQLYAWKIIYGRWLVFSYGEEGEGFNWFDLAAVEVLFSPNHGLFYWHPLLVFGAAGFLVWALKYQLFAQWWVCSMVLTYVISAAWWCWWLGSSFGQRNFEAVVLFFMCGMGYLFERLNNLRLARRIFEEFVLVAVIWNINLVILYCVNCISRNGPVTWLEMIQATIALYSFP